MNNVSYYVIQDVLNAAVKFGLNTDLVCERAQFYRPSLMPDKRYPVSTLIRLWQEAANLTGFKNYGLKQGQYFEVGTLNILGFILMNSETLEQALEHYCHYQRIIGDAIQLDIETHSEFCSITIKLCHPDLWSVQKDAVEMFAASLITSCSFLTGRRIKAKKIFFSHMKPKDISEYFEIFQITPTFDSGRDVLQLFASDLACNISLRDPRVLSLGKQSADKMLSSLSNSQFSSQVTQQFGYINNCGQMKIDQVADRMNLSIRVLQLRLAKEKTSFQKLLNEYRINIAYGLLKDTQMPIGDIAYILGYKDTSSFGRAFQKISETSPGQFRGRFA